MEISHGPAGGDRSAVAVEVRATALAAERITPEILDRMTLHADEMDAATDFETYRLADVRFHLAIAEAGAVPRVVAAMTGVRRT